MKKSGIGGLNEKSLHRQLKDQYATTESLVEEKVEGYIVDIANPDGIIEIQTSNLSGIKEKLTALLQKNRVLLVHPVASETIINVYNKDGTVRSRRRSPKRCSVYSAAAQILYIAELLPNPNLSLDIAVVRQEEIRYDDGRGSWRRGGVSIEDRLLSSIEETFSFNDLKDYLRLLPQGLPERFGNREIAELLPSTGTGKKGKLKLAGQISWLLRKIGLIELDAKEGKRLIFKRLINTDTLLY